MHSSFDLINNLYLFLFDPKSLLSFHQREMGNSESSSQFPPPPNNNNKNKRISNWDQPNKSSEEKDDDDKGTTSSALKIGAAVAGTALLALGAFSSQFPPPPNDNNKNKGISNWDQPNKSAEEKEDDDKGTESSALPIGAAVAGTALLALGAFSLTSSSSSHSGESDDARKRVTQMEEVVHEGFASSSNSRGGYRDHGYQTPRNPTPYAENLNPGFASQMIKIMSYNVWFREDVEVRARMKAIGQLIQEHSPDIIFFQEVTPNIYKFFQDSNWWRTYRCSVPPEKVTRKYFCMLLSKLPVEQFMSQPFQNSWMGRDLCAAEIDAGANKKLVVATSHLESPTPPEMNSVERVAQAREALSLLNSVPNVIFGGDMNWDEISDGPFPLLGGWQDAWSVLRLGEDGWTYDTRSNAMLKGNRTLSKRLDRFVCKLQDFRMVSVDMIGRDAIPGISYYNKRKELPVLPSDHYGLVLTICRM